jgi:hypothetical protein
MTVLMLSCPVVVLLLFLTLDFFKMDILQAEIDIIAVMRLWI